MMQDYPKLLSGSPELDNYAKRVSFCQYPKWTSFSAVKNALSDAAAKQKAGNATECGSSGEMDIYNWHYTVLKQANVQVEPPRKMTYAGVEVDEPAHIVLHPIVGVSQKEVRSKFSGGQNVHITADSTLVVDVHNIQVESLNLKGTLIIDAKSSPTDINITVKNLTVKNDGWHFRELRPDEFDQVDQKYAVRGYVLNKKGQDVYQFTKPGSYTLSDETKSQYART
jgi:hypothetical protein